MSYGQSQIRLRLEDGFLTSPPLSQPLSSSPSSSASLPYNGDYQKQSTPPSSSSSGSKISPAILFIIVILAVIFFISGLLHLLIRFLTKHRTSSSITESDRYPEMSGSDAFQRQLQQLFHLHDSGLDQAFIDALPVFLYKEIMGLKEPFDCPVCLCEFSEQDKLRGNLYTPGFDIENPVFYFEDSREEDGISSIGGSGVISGQKPSENEIVSEKRVFSIRLGKFRSSNDGGGGGGGGVERGEEETSSSNLDARRCYSMGSYQYVVADSELQVALCPNGIGGSMRIVKGRAGQNGNSTIDGDGEGKKINFGSKGESFSVSKIWQWSKKSKFTSSSETGSSSATVSLPWPDRSQCA
ncbi:RING-H2 finger protein ATL46 isoform X2 [Corylus avellana]|uniref:RING-H2 finger protein ATL46 isoform X2 n=1 Tax=Corylus avellana TaxID=13451 RepID=UPI00286C6EBD|nr:RING-H2 finger protein ATL46 isoform X2 [Corylus avellana]